MKTLSAHPSGKEASATTSLRRFTKVTASLLSSAALIACVLASRPCAAQPPLINLRVEEPVYAGLPVWLDVEAADPCIAVHYQGSLIGDASGGRAEVAGADGATLPPGFRPHYGRPIGSMLRREGACTARELKDATTNRIPLHLVADLKKPGHYAVRWIVPRNDRLGNVPSTSLTFTVRSGTDAQRESWLTGLLANQPADLDALRETFIPALLAASGDPRVTDRLLDILCEKDRPTSTSVSHTLDAALSDGAQLRLARRISGGCLSDGLVEYVDESVRSDLLFGVMPDRERRRLLEATLSSLTAARGPALANALEIADLLKENRSDDVAKAADATVMHAVPRILAEVDLDVSSADQIKAMLLQYVSARNRLPGAKGVIEALADRPGETASDALRDLVFGGGGDPADIPYLQERLLGPLDGVPFPERDDDFNRVATAFGSPGVGAFGNTATGQDGTRSCGSGGRSGAGRPASGHAGRHLCPGGRRHRGAARGARQDRRHARMSHRG